MNISATTGHQLAIHSRKPYSRRHPRRSLTERLSKQYQRLARQQRTLFHIALIFRDQAAILPVQCEEAITRLDNLRRASRCVQTFLNRLDPETIQRTRPWATIEKLTMLDYQLTEAILCIAMHAQVCEAITYARIELHLYIRSLFPQVLVTFEDTISQLAAVIDHHSQTQDAERT